MTGARAQESQEREMWMEPTIDALDGWQGIFLFYWPGGLFLLRFFGCGVWIPFFTKMNIFVGAILKPFLQGVICWYGGEGDGGFCRGWPVHDLARWERSSNRRQVRCSLSQRKERKRTWADEKLYQPVLQFQIYLFWDCGYWYCSLYYIILSINTGGTRPPLQFGNLDIDIILYIYISCVAYGRHRAAPTRWRMVL